LSRRDSNVVDKRDESSRPSSNFLQPDSGLKSAGTASDCAVLFAATLLPVILNIQRLGFYADDLGNMGRFQGNHDSTFADYFYRLYRLPGTHGRPAMDLYLAVLYRLFGVHHIGYQVVNVIVIFASVLLLYFSLRLVLRERFVALTVPLIFALLPNYSSARWVPCSFMAALSMAFYFVNLYTLLKSSSKATLAVGWACASVAAVVVSGFLYEILLPLFALNLLVVWGLQRQKPSGERLRPPSLALLSVANGFALLSVLVYKKLTATRPHELASVRYVVTQAIVVHFYKLGFRLPVVAAKVIFVYGNPTLNALALVFGVFVFCYFLRLQRSADNAERSLIALRLVAFGILIFAFALTIFVSAGGATGFTATGFENRTAIGVSLGMAFIFSGVSIWIGGLIKLHRAFFVSLVIALLCSGELLATSAIASYWAAAADRQELVLNAIRQDIPTMPANSALIVDGVCPYIGPGIVFEGHQDMGGALQMLYHDASLRGDVVNSQLLVHDYGIETSIYGRYRFYNYGHVKVYDFRRRKAWDLRDFNAAIEYFGRMGPAHSFCPEGAPGEGVPIF
jgi:hypothetical protein